MNKFLNELSIDQPKLQLGFHFVLMSMVGLFTVAISKYLIVDSEINSESYMYSVLDLLAFSTLVVSTAASIYGLYLIWSAFFSTKQSHENINNGEL